MWLFLKVTIIMLIINIPVIYWKYIGTRYAYTVYGKRLHMTILVGYLFGINIGIAITLLATKN